MERVADIAICGLADCDFFYHLAFVRTHRSTVRLYRRHLVSEVG